MTFLWAAIDGKSPLDVWIAAVVIMAALALIVLAALKVIERVKSSAPSLVGGQRTEGKPLVLPKPLKELFDGDFPNLGKKTRPVALNYNNWAPINCVMLVHQDFDSGTEFISFYVPKCGKIVEVCDYFVNNFRRDYDQLKAQIHFNIRAPGETIMDRSADLRLSGRVYLYHEDEITYQALAQVTQLFERHDLTVRFRGPKYVADEWNKRLLAQH
jgi:hypothetical protein